MPLRYAAMATLASRYAMPALFTLFAATIFAASATYCYVAMMFTLMLALYFLAIIRAAARYFAIRLISPIRRHMPPLLHTGRYIFR